MEHYRPLTVIVLLTLMLAAAFGLAGCGGRTVSTSPSPPWTPAPKLTASYASFKWPKPASLRGKLLPKTWTFTQSFRLNGGPASMEGLLKVPGSSAPRFTARLMPDQHATGFAGYAATATPGVWHLPMMTAGEGFLADWFPYALPAGSYRVTLREVGGPQTGGTYDIGVAGVK